MGLSGACWAAVVSVAPLGDAGGRDREVEGEETGSRREAWDALARRCSRSQCAIGRNPEAANGHDRRGQPCSALEETPTHDSELCTLRGNQRR